VGADEGGWRRQSGIRPGSSSSYQMVPSKPTQKISSKGIKILYPTGTPVEEDREIEAGVDVTIGPDG